MPPTVVFIIPSEQLFTREQVEEIIEEMSRKFSLDKSGDSYTKHSKGTLVELENNSTIHL